jgi:hypothetical protein
MKNAVFWDVTSCGSCKRARNNVSSLQRASELVTANVLPCSLIRAAWRNISEDDILLHELSTLT